MWARCRVSGGLDTSNRAVSIRHDSWGVSQCRAGARRPHGGVVAVRSPRSHAGPWFRFFFAFSGRIGPYEKPTAIVISRHAGVRRGLRLGYRASGQWTSLVKHRFVEGVSFADLANRGESNHAPFVSCDTGFRLRDCLTQTLFDVRSRVPKVIKITRWDAVSQTISALVVRSSGTVL
jgi:hypothetical protein